MNTELLQIVDAETGEPTGELRPRNEVIANHLWCRSTNIFILNTEGSLLCQQRSKSKERYPGAWSTHFGGHVTEGESFKINALKELEEEIGLSINAFALVPWRTSKIEKARLWVRDFITVWSGDISTLKLQESEIESVAWHTPYEIIDFLNTEGVYDDTPLWMAGTHDFMHDYHCMRAVLTAMIDTGVFGGDWKPLHKWVLVNQKQSIAM